MMPYVLVVLCSNSSPVISWEQKHDEEVEKNWEEHLHQEYLHN